MNYLPPHGSPKSVSKDIFVTNKGGSNVVDRRVEIGRGRFRVQYDHKMENTISNASYLPSEF